MAVELGRFISEQLSKLPQDHPDRPFIEATRAHVQEYLGKSEVTPRKIIPLHEYFQSKKQGPFLDMDVLTSARTDEILSIPTRRYKIPNVIEDIQENGSDSLYHLCLPVQTTIVLMKTDITTIPQLREFLVSGRDRELSRKSRKRVHTMLEQFDKQLQELPNL